MKPDRDLSEGEYPDIDEDTLCRIADELFLELDEREAQEHENPSNSVEIARGADLTFESRELRPQRD